MIGYPQPNTTESSFDYFDIGLRNGSGPGSKIEWRPIGQYLRASVKPTWGIEPGSFSFTLHPKHPLVDVITNVKRTCWHFRAGYNGFPEPILTGRIFDRDFDGEPDRDPWTYSGFCNKVWLSGMYAWVNNLFPPEIQIGLTGKQDMRWGWPDPVFKSYVSSVATRLNVPVHSALPIKVPSGWGQPNTEDINSLSDLLDIIFGFGDGFIGLQARFPSLSDLFKPTANRLEMGISTKLWDGHTPSPKVFNTSSLAALQSIIDRTSDNFLDLSKLLVPANNGLYQLTMDRAGYVFDTHEKRDRKNVQFRTDGGQITRYKYNEHHSDAYLAIVGGKSPSIVNDIIEIGANLAIAAIIAAIATIPGLGGIAGLSVGVGDLFDNIFFAYQQFWDDDVRDEIGQDDAIPEGFADNTAAHSIDAYAVAKGYLHDHGGKETLEITATGGTQDGRGITFGPDNGTARRYQLGDTITCWDRGNAVEQYVSDVEIVDEPGSRVIEKPSIGRDKRAKGPWDRAFGALGQIGTTLDGLANAV